MIRAEVTERIGWLTLDRPECRNVLSPDMLTEIVACLQAWAQSTSVNVVVIKAEGPSFSAGLDRDWIQSESADKRRTLQFASSRFHRELFGLRIPSIAMVHGQPWAPGWTSPCYATSELPATMPCSDIPRSSPAAHLSLPLFDPSSVMAGPESYA